MKRLYLGMVVVLIASLSFAGTIQQRHIMIIGQEQAAGGACATLKDSETGAEDGTFNFGEWSDEYYIATKFTTTSAYTVCKIVAYLKRTGSPSGNIDAAIFTHDAGEDDPDSIVDSWSDSVAMSSVQTGSTEAITFANASGTLSDATVYWVVLRASSVEESNFMEWGYDNAVETQTRKDGDGSGTWGSLNVYTCRYGLYSN